MTTETIQVKRTAVQASDSLVGKTVLLPDGSKSKITGVPSGTSYSIEGQRARASAYLIVKEGRVFKLLTQDEVEGTVVSVKDSGGYATYKFAPVSKKPAGRTSRRPKNEEVEPKKPAGRTSRRPKDEEVEPKKPAGRVARKVKEKNVDAVVAVSPAVSLITEAGLPLSEKHMVLLRKELTQLIASHIHAGLPEEVTITSESKFSDQRFHLSVGIDFSCLAPSEVGESVSIDDALDALIENELVTAREARRMSDEEILSMYEMMMEDSEGSHAGELDIDDDLGSEYSDEGDDDETEDDDNQPTQEEIKLPDEACKNFDSLKGKDREAILASMIDATGLEECVAGSLFALADKEGNDDGTVAFVNFVRSPKSGQPSALLMRVEPFEESGTIKRVALSASQFSRLTPIFGETYGEHDELGEDDELDSDLDLEGL